MNEQSSGYLPGSFDDVGANRLSGNQHRRLVQHQNDHALAAEHGFRNLKPGESVFQPVNQQGVFKRTLGLYILGNAQGSQQVAAAGTKTFTVTPDKDFEIVGIFPQARTAAAGTNGEAQSNLVVTDLKIAGDTVIGGGTSIPVNLLQAISRANLESEEPKSMGWVCMSTKTITITIQNDSAAAIDCEVGYVGRLVTKQ